MLGVLVHRAISSLSSGKNSKTTKFGGHGKQQDSPAGPAALRAVPCPTQLSAPEGLAVQPAFPPVPGEPPACGSPGSPALPGEAHPEERHDHGTAEPQVVLQRDLRPRHLPPPRQPAQLPAELRALRQP